MKVHTIDLQFQNVGLAIAAYLVEGDHGGLALIECGPSSTLETLQDGIRKLGFEPEEVKHVLVTHIHLDHAGAAGWWAQQGAQVYVHHRGAKHIVTPDRLLESARMVYGGAMDSLWGEVLPAPAEKVTALNDNDIVDADGLKITAWDTPGHARHHMTYVIGNTAFTGDVAGARLPRSKWISVTGAPSQFDPVAYDASLTRLGLADLSTLYLTHYGRVGDVMDHLMQYQQEVKAAAEWIRAKREEGLRGPELGAAYEDHCREEFAKHGLSDAMWDTYEAANPASMSATGISLYWQTVEGSFT